MTDPGTSFLLITGTFILAGTVKGMTGLGLPTVAMGLLSLSMPPVEAAALLLMPSFVTNVWQLLSGPRLWGLLSRLWGMMAAIMLGTVAGAGLIAGGAGRSTMPVLGLALALYGASGLLKPRLTIPARMQTWAGPLVGVATGIVTGATGVFVIPAVPYLGSLGLERDEMVQALGLSFTVSTVALAVGLAAHHALPGIAIGTSLLTLGPALAGMLFGGWIRTRIRAETFRTIFFTGLVLLGGELVWRGIA
ncbi:sulfite exporter TauE/SafE family protein [Rhodopseudomonas sp. B29]|uniref:sulfite exporter TauE/SafE family protein n=1 Tax=Rhodopseudomonas sp. B29 TaxID=95607 RepID=UPI00034ADD4D|nr:sulfite exporter TauE/SafE family protein [Rhodopseudomonas sp. B29]